ncbi:MAG: hypothetical protein ACKO2L_15315 [Planctomycetaceae bacterium]
MTTAHRYWVRQPGKAGFRGPFTLAEIQRCLRSGDFSFDAEVLPVEDPSQTTFAHLLNYSEWVSVCTIFPPESITALPNTQEAFARESVVRLADLRRNSVYPLLRMVVRTAQLVGVLIVVFNLNKMGAFSGQKLVEFVATATVELLLLALVTCTVEVLTDIADAQLEDRRRR